MLCERCGVEIISVRDTASGLCYNCIEDDKKIKQLRDKGHTHHCACRIVFDGICICKQDHINKKIQSENIIKFIKSANEY